MIDQQNWHLYTAPDSTYGFDANCTITSATAEQFKDEGYAFAIRYVGRLQQHAGDLTDTEATDILSAGLALGIVQHVESADAWTPSLLKGGAYGSFAADSVRKIGCPPGTMIWCDLEGVETHVPPTVTLSYLQAWHSAVAAAGYVPGCYVGWHSGLTADQLYKRTPFTHFWAAYNLNGDEYPAIRGVQMQQRVVGSKPQYTRPEGCTIEFDVDITQLDRLGSSPVFLARLGWAD